MINVGWLAARVPSSDRLCRILVLCDLYQALRRSRCAWGRKCEPCPEFTSNTLAFVLLLRKITEIPSKCNLMALGCPDSNAIRFSTWPSRGKASTDRLTPAALGFRVRRRVQPSVSLRICWVVVLGGSPHHLNLGQSSRSGLWCCRKTAQHPDPRVYACYLRTKGHQ